MTISSFSPELKAAFVAELEKLPQDMNPDKAAFKAMQKVVQRINAGETGLFDPTNSGDSVALLLAEM